MAKSVISAGLPGQLNLAVAKKSRSKQIKTLVQYRHIDSTITNSHININMLTLGRDSSKESVGSGGGIPKSYKRSVSLARL